VPENDRELVRRHLAGDANAFNELARRHEKRVYNLAYRMLGRPDDARDAAQEAFLAAYRRLSAFRGDAAFSTWLYRITVNACYDVLRRRARDPEPAEIEDRDTGSPDPADRTATAVDVQRALLRVPDEFRAALVLHDVQDLPYEDIAEILGVPVGTVKSRLHRGRVALARALEGTAGAATASEEMNAP
jgi:RNA polymerase sigma-70 factor (ECF subfamily)